MMLDDDVSLTGNAGLRLNAAHAFVRQNKGTRATFAVVRRRIQLTSMALPVQGAQISDRDPLPATCAPGILRSR